MFAVQSKPKDAALLPKERPSLSCFIHCSQANSVVPSFSEIFKMTARVSFPHWVSLTDQEIVSCGFMIPLLPK